jgi:transposase InsO family protein
MEERMPWKETVAMKERYAFIARQSLGKFKVAELCRDFGVSRKTGYKWIDRFEAEGPAGLADRSHAPHNTPHKTDPAIAREVIRVRQTHPTWGPLKVRAFLEMHDPGVAWPAPSTIGDLLTAANLTVPRKRKRRTPAGAPFGKCEHPNDVWTVDFKGWFRTRDGERCDPLTLQDAFSRYLLRCRALARTDGDHVWRVFDEAFREFGLPLRVRSDNGAPFASIAAGGLSALAVKLIKAGITPERIAPGKPQQNGRHERFHLTLQQDTAAPPAGNRRAQQRAFDAFRTIYNNERPHEALKLTPPIRHYVPSPRRYDGHLREPEYPNHCQLRRVRLSGEIKWKGNMIFVSRVLHSETVACEEIDNDIWALFFGPIQLGILDHRRKLVRSSPAYIGRRGSQTPPSG